MPRASAPRERARLHLHRQDREIIALAVPAFGALVVEPLFLLADSAIVGHLGTPQLAGLGVAATLLTTAVSIFVFLAYATTAAVARRAGAGDLPAAIRQGVDGIWLALLLGVAVVAVVLPAAPALVSAFGASSAATPHAVTYLRISALGIPAMLIVLAATGVLRGLQDTRTPLYVAIGGFTANAALNVALVYGAGLGIAGSAWGTVIAQCGMAGIYLAVVIRGALRHQGQGQVRDRSQDLGQDLGRDQGQGRNQGLDHGRGQGLDQDQDQARNRGRENQNQGQGGRARGQGWWAALRPDAAGIRAGAQAGAPLLVRTLCLRAVLVIATAVAARLGDADVAAHQIVFTIWSLLAFALDAIAIAGQAIIGRCLGAGDAKGARDACRRMVQWGIASGVVLGLLLVSALPLIVPLFTTDPAVHDRLLPALLVVAVTEPIAGVVFVLDGVLMGAGDGRYLARAMVVVLAVFLPAALLVPSLGGGLTALWWTIGGLMMGARLATLWLRARSGQWVVTGAVRA